MAIGIMEVKLVGAKGLKFANIFNKVDPYVVLQYRIQEHRSTTARGQGHRPVWNEKFQFRVEYPMADEKYKLVLKIMDHNLLISDGYLGQSTIYVKDLIELGIERGKAKLRTQKYRVVTADKAYRGEIKVRITFTKKEESEDEEEQEEYGGWKESDLSHTT